ncbi:MAG: MarR family transcriptional regulator [Candidatus Omnitrophica bacterium]|nr:MarR family transcriptional regulator [Candidatus Omnitrophota bacterium]
MTARKAFAANFREIHPKFSRFYVQVLQSAGVSLPQYALLNQLAHSGPVSMTEVSGRLQITKPAVTNLVDRLEEKKCLRRLPHPKDRRVILLTLLPKGAKLVRRVQTAGLNLLLKAYDHFNETEHAVISRFYSSLSKTLDQLSLKEKHGL